jgi:uncharacterized protein YcfL
VSSMQKRLLLGVVVLVFVSTILSGCQDTSSIQTKQRPQNVFLDSTLVEFVNVTYEETTNKSGGIESVTVGWLFHNIAGKIISIKINVKFYDKNNLFLYNTSKFFNDMPLGYTEQTMLPSNKVIYDGPNVASVDHVVISVTEK